MQAVSSSYCFGLSESNGGLQVPDFQTLHKSTRIAFDISVYNSPIDTGRFHAMVCDIYRLSVQAEPTPFHRFLDALAHNGCLLRHYTQNIDCIEHHLPNLWEKTVQLHGRIDEAMCQYCGWNGPLVSDRFCGSDLPDCNPDLKKLGTVGGCFAHFEGLEEREANDLLLQTAEVCPPWHSSATNLATTITKALGYLP